MKKYLDILGQVAMIVFLVFILFFPFEAGEAAARIANAMWAGFLSELDMCIIDQLNQ